MKVFLSVSFVASMIFSFSASARAQQPQCDKDCIHTVRGILKASYLGYSISFLDKANDRLGDKIGVAVLKIYPGKSLYRPDNIRTFLPVIQEAFKYPELIENPSDKNPMMTIALLHKLQRRVKDHFLRMDITKTLNVVMFTAKKAESISPARELR
jgi:hypothetical protein